MKALLTASLVFLGSLLFAEGEDAAPETKTKKPPFGAVSEGNMKSIMMIDPKDRASDFIKAFDTLRKEIAPIKIFFHISKGAPISNIMDLTLMENGTLMLFRISTPQGPQYKIVPVEDLLDITHNY